MNPAGTPRSTLNNSTAHDSKNAALKGASLAFQKAVTPKPSPKPSPAASTSRHVDNSALTAAASASRDHSVSGKIDRLSRQTIGNSIRDGGRGQGMGHGTMSRRSPQHLQPMQSNQGSTLLLPPGARPTMGADPRSPSFIAATLAANRSASPSPCHTGHLRPQAQQHVTSRGKRANSIGSQSAASSITNLDLTDTASIAPMNSLISMFEKTGSSTDPVKKGHVSPDYKLEERKRLRPMTPSRQGASSPASKADVSPSLMASNLAWQRAAHSPSPVSIVASKQDEPHLLSNQVADSRKSSPTSPARASREDRSPGLGASPAVMKRRLQAATPPRPASQAETVILSPKPRRITPHRMVASSEPVEREMEMQPRKRKPPPIKPKPRARSVHDAPSKTISLDTKPKQPTNRPRRSSSTSSRDTFVSASSAPSPDSGSPRRGRSHSPGSGPTLPRRPVSVRSVPISPRSRRKPVPPPPRRAQPQTSNLALNSLTNATMAGILASSRITPDTPATPPAPPSRKPTPHMRQTMRKPRSQSDDETARSQKERHRKKPLGGHKKHAHHEGTRKRWREMITERERKRYEGLWASNRGLLLSTDPNTGEHDLVANIVVRDTWSRSRLPFDELAEVWDLVDHRGKGVLDKTEFVVGMWLIDQRLRGRKTPQKVGESVWSSARGVNVKGPKAKR